MRILRFVLRLLGVALFLVGLYLTIVMGYGLSRLNGQSATAIETMVMTIAVLGTLGPLMVLGVHLAYWRWCKPRRRDVVFHVLVWVTALPGILLTPYFSLITATVASVFIAVARGGPQE